MHTHMHAHACTHTHVRTHTHTYTPYMGDTHTPDTMTAFHPYVGGIRTYTFPLTTVIHFPPYSSHHSFSIVLPG